MNRKYIFTAVTLLCGLTLLVLLRIRSANDPRMAAQSVLSGFVRNDADLVFDYRIQDEAERSGLTRESFRSLWKEIVAPALARCKAVGPEVSESLNDPPTEGVAETMLLMPDGQRFQLAVATWVTESGPKYQLLWNTLSMAWLLRFAMEHPAEHARGLNFYRARLEGLHRDRAFLEGLGVKGMVGASGYFLTWD